jgi:GNAT superfamily N-acetyltransferase
MPEDEGPAMPEITIRDARPQDVPTILHFIRELAAFEQAAESVIATEADLLRDGFGPTPRFFCRMALLDDEPVGYALCFRNYSSWEGRAGIYLEDLYVTEAARGHDIGRKLIADLAALAIREDARRLDLSVLDWNPARGFYEKLGLGQLTEWLRYRAEGEVLRRLAGEA